MEVLGRGKVAVLGALMLGAGAAWGEVHEVEVRNQGSDGQRMVFEPALVEAAPGDTVRFVFEDMGHNAAAYHPDNRGKPSLVPEGAAAWDSGFKKPGDTFEVTFDTEGRHHYFCLPHEGMAMVGLIAVGDADQGPGPDAVESSGIPDEAKAELRKLHEELDG